mmetsp:Transcript_20263/g.38323  ORF Transcript_20263/g.38323 Transcript_20263/m.38323 type:complete len:357 (-) Transcript_20263:118-1188(-)
MAHPLSAEYESNQRLPNVQDLDVTVLAFAQWLSEMRARSNSSLQQMLAEMGIIRNGITSNNTDLTEFKRNTATVQQQMQSQISDLRDKLTDAYQEIANMKKTKSQFEQEVHAEYQSMFEQLKFKTVELEGMKQAYAQTHQQFQQQIIQLTSEVNEMRIRGDDVLRQRDLANEQHVTKVGEVELATQYASTELKRLRADHDQAISNLAENMNRWNETLRDLSKEFHDFQKVMNVNQQRIQSSMWDMQAKSGMVTAGPSPNGNQPPGAVVESDIIRAGTYGRMDSADMAAAQRSPPRQGGTSPPPSGIAPQQLRPQTSAAPAQAQAPGVTGPRRPVSGASMMQGYAAPTSQGQPYVMR